MIYLMDTDHLRLIDRDSVESVSLGLRLAKLAPEQVYASVITYEEQMRGWLAVISAAKTLEKQVEGYERLRRHIERYRVIQVLDFDAKAAVEFARLQKLKLRVGTMDLKIAAIALANDAILLTRNSTDFGKIPGLKFADWSL